MTNDFYYSIKRVKDIYFSINERSYIPDPDKIIKIELGEQIGFNPGMDLVKFTLRIYLHYQDSQEILCDIQIENVFEVQNIKRFMNETGIIILPKELIVSIVSMSLSHGRALLLRNTAGTLFQDVVLPITNPFEVASHFYPYMFGGEVPSIPAVVPDNDDKEKSAKLKETSKKRTKHKSIKKAHSE